MGKTVNPSIRIYTNKIENIITSKFKATYYFELLTPKKRNYLGVLKVR